MMGFDGSGEKIVQRVISNQIVLSKVICHEEGFVNYLMVNTASQPQGKSHLHI
jgi:hypothetical protein